MTSFDVDPYTEGKMRVQRVFERRWPAAALLSLLVILGLAAPAQATPNPDNRPVAASSAMAVSPAAAQSIMAAKAKATSVADDQTCLMDGPPAAGSTPPPFLKLPFRQSDGTRSLWDSEGWYTSPDELSIDAEGNGELHAANDLELTRQANYGYGLPVLAAASGRAYFSYQYISGSWTDPTTGITHQVGWGAGLVVEIRHAPDTPGNPGWVTQYIHLSRVAKGIPYLSAVAEDDPNDPTHPDYYPAGLVQDDDTLWNSGVDVKQGQVIGYQGDTGIGYDWKDNFNPMTGIVTPRNRAVLKPWDPPQLHFQLYQGRVNGAKQNIIDPFGLYAQVCTGELHWKTPGWDLSGTFKYANPYTPRPGIVRQAPQGSVFMTNQRGDLLYAAR